MRNAFLHSRPSMQDGSAVASGTEFDTLWNLKVAGLSLNIGVET